MDAEFKRHSDETLRNLYRALVLAADDYGFKVEFNSGAVAVEFNKPPAKFVISPHAAPRQIWVTSRAKSYKLDWDIVENTFVLEATGQNLRELMEQVIGKQVGDDVSL